MYSSNDLYFDQNGELFQGELWNAYAVVFPSLSLFRIRPTSLVHPPPPAVASKMRSSITTLSAREGLILTEEELQQVQLEAEKRYKVSYMAVVGHSWQTTKVATVL